MNKMIYIVILVIASVVLGELAPVNSNAFLSRFAIPICSVAFTLLSIFAARKQQNIGSKNTILSMTIFGLIVLCVLQITLSVLEKPLTMSGRSGVGVFLGFVMLVTGNFMPRTKPNAAFGLRLPWTLANEDVWRKSNRFAGKLFMAAGIVMIALSFVFTSVLETVILLMVLCVTVLTILVSYSYHRQLMSGRTEKI